MGRPHKSLRIMLKFSERPKTPEIDAGRLIKANRLNSG